MAGIAKRLREPTVVPVNGASAREDVLDLGAYPEFDAQVRVIKAGTGGTIFLQTSASLDGDTFLTITGTSRNLNAVSNAHIHVGEFLRYLRWASDGAVADQPVAMIDIVARE